MKNQKLEIVLEGFDLSSTQLKGLEKEVNSLVAKHLVNAQISKSIGTKLRINPEWLGIWLKNSRMKDCLIKQKLTSHSNYEKTKVCMPFRYQQRRGIAFGIVGNDGVVKFLPHTVALDEELLSLGNSHSNPEAKFRYTQTCAEKGCKQWTGEKCGVIDKVFGMKLEAIGHQGLKCPIMNDCRWYAQEGPKACGVCPLVVADLI